MKIFWLHFQQQKWKNIDLQQPGKDKLVWEMDKNASDNNHHHQSENIELSYIPSDNTKKPSEFKKLPDNSKDIIGSIIGDIGKWQLRAIFLIFLCKIPAAWFMACIIFTAPTPRHGEFYCKPPKVLMKILLSYISFKP